MKLRPGEEISLDCKTCPIQGLGHGSGGLTVRMDFSVVRSSKVNILPTVVSDMYEGDFQFLSVLSRLQMFTSMLWRTFHSRIPNPISKRFICYWLEPIGKDNPMI